MNMILLLIFILSFFNKPIFTNDIRLYDSEQNQENKGNILPRRNLCTEGGSVQSPIDIRVRDAPVDFHNKFISGGLNLLGYSKVLMTVINTGLMAHFRCDGSRSIHPLVFGGPLHHEYRLEQMHFHRHSEHAINGKRYPMEIHMIHVRSDLTIEEALLVSDGLAIFAVFCDVDLEVEDAASVKEVVPLVLMLRNSSQITSGVILDLWNLLPKNIDSYLSYAGSLTSPTCDEAVIWIVFDTPLSITESQYKHLSELDTLSQPRSLQPHNKHRVYRPYVPNFRKPAIFKMAEDVFEYLKDIYANLTMNL